MKLSAVCTFQTHQGPRETSMWQRRLPLMCVLQESRPRLPLPPVIANPMWVNTYSWVVFVGAWLQVPLFAGSLQGARPSAAGAPAYGSRYSNPGSRHAGGVCRCAAVWFRHAAAYSFCFSWRDCSGALVADRQRMRLFVSVHTLFWPGVLRLLNDCHGCFTKPHQSLWVMQLHCTPGPLDS